MKKPIVILVVAVLLLGLGWSGWSYWKSRGGYNGGNGTPSGGTDQCPVGSYWNYGGVQYRIAGYENHSLGGSTQRLCCGSWEDNTSNEKMKYCYDADAQSDHFITWVANAETGGELKKSMESYQQGEQTCFRLFDAQENVVAESCQ